MWSLSHPPPQRPPRSLLSLSINPLHQLSSLLTLPHPPPYLRRPVSAIPVLFALFVGFRPVTSNTATRLGQDLQTKGERRMAMRRGVFHLPWRGAGAVRARRPSPRASCKTRAWDLRLRLPRGGCTARLGGVGSSCVPQSRLSLALSLHPCAAQSFATFRSFGEAASPCARASVRSGSPDEKIAPDQGAVLYKLRESAQARAGCKQHTCSLFEATKLN